MGPAIHLHGGLAVRRMGRVQAACLIAIAWLFLFVLGSPTSAAEAPSRVTLTILHTNDMHAHWLPGPGGRGGLANIAALVRRIRAEQPNVLLLDAGDMTQGTPVSSMFCGTPIFEAMSAVGYDAAILGNHELDNGSQYVAEYRRIARFPILSATVFKNGALLADAPTTTVHVGGLAIGLIGLTKPFDIDEPGVVIETPLTVAAETVPRLRRDAQLVIALTHQGVTADRALAARVPGIDVIVGGHTHTALQTPERVGRAIIVQAGLWGEWLGRLDLTIDPAKKEVVAFEGRLIPIPQPDLAPDPQVARLIDGWESKIAPEMDLKIGDNPRALDPDELGARVAEIWRVAFGADIGAQNDGGTRAPLPAGAIRVRNIWEALIFDNTLVILDLTRAQAAEMLEGAKFSEDKPLYTLITNSYMARQIEKQLNLPPDRVHDTGVSWRDPVIESIKAHGGIEALAPEPARN